MSAVAEPARAVTEPIFPKEIWALWDMAACEWIEANHEGAKLWFDSEEDAEDGAAQVNELFGIDCKAIQIK